MKKAREKANTCSAAFELYLDSVGCESLDRAGNNMQLKGVIHEILFRDKLNLNPVNMWNGKRAMLTRNPHAHAVDVVQMQNGKNVGRYQLKDCTSPAGIRDTLTKVRTKKYHSTKLMGTRETVAGYNKSKTTTDQPMESTNISSSRTTRVADNAGVQCKNKDLLWSNLQDIGACSAQSAALGAALSGMSALATGMKRCARGEISKAEVIGNVVIESGRGAVNAGGTTAAALALKEGAKALGQRLGGESLKKLAGGNAATAAAFAAVEIGQEAVRCLQGKSTPKDLAKTSLSATSSAAGGYGGTLAGMALGTALCPGIGTALFGLAGALSGGLGGRVLGHAIGRLFD